MSLAKVSSPAPSGDGAKPIPPPKAAKHPPAGFRQPDAAPPLDNLRLVASGERWQSVAWTAPIETAGAVGAMSCRRERLTSSRDPTCIRRSAARGRAARGARSRTICRVFQQYPPVPDLGGPSARQEQA